MRYAEINGYFRWWRGGHNFLDSCEISANSVINLFNLMRRKWRCPNTPMTHEFYPVSLGISWCPVVLLWRGLVQAPPHDPYPYNLCYQVHALILWWVKLQWANSLRSDIAKRKTSPIPMTSPSRSTLQTLQTDLSCLSCQDKNNHCFDLWDLCSKIYTT